MAILIPTEHAIQSAFIDWTFVQEKRNPDYGDWFAVPNGGHRHPAVAVKLKKEGVKKGVPDLWWPNPLFGWHGLVIETKNKRGKVSNEQRDWLRRLAVKGYLVSVTFDLDEMIGITLAYEKGELGSWQKHLEQGI